MRRSKMRRAVWSTLSALAFAGHFAFAQLAPTGEHYGGRPSDTGYGGAQVSASGSIAASIPFDLPPARGGLPIPLRVSYGAGGVGAAGVGCDLELSYIQQGVTFAHRRPASAVDVLPSPRGRVYIALAGQSAELIRNGNSWTARHGTLELAAVQTAAGWSAYDGSGRTYTFQQPPGLANTGLWLLNSIAGPGGANVHLTYQLTTWPLDGGSGNAIDLVGIEYNAGPAASCAKNLIALSYGTPSTNPLSLSVVGSQILVRKRTLAYVDVNSRATCADAPQRLRRYAFQYAPDTDTQLPRLVAATMSGLQGTPEENISLPIGSYAYGSATTNGALHYQTTQTINLPAGMNYDGISNTALDPSVNAPGPGDRYAMWQTLTDMTGDGRPDLVFQKNGKLWVAYNQPAAAGHTTIGSGIPGVVQLSDPTFSAGPVSTHTSAMRRFDYAPANRNTTNIWREAIDINGDGRMDIIDAAEEADHWVVYLNTPGPTGVLWQRRSFLVSSLRAALTSNGHTLDGPFVPLSRRATGTDLQTWRCWRFTGTDWTWYAQGFANHVCEGVDQQVVTRGPERTFVEWELADINGDGYPDFVFDYRGSLSPVNKNFNQGFTARGTSTDVMKHALDSSNPPSAYVSTSLSPEVAQRFGSNVYTIRPVNGINVNQVLGSGSPNPDELEIAIPWRIDPSDIRAVTDIIRGITHLNPNWRP